MRILQVVQSYPPEASGGTEWTVVQLASDLRALGHHVTVLAGSLIEEAEFTCLEEVYDGVSVTRFRRARRYRSPLDAFDPDVALAFDRLLDEIRPDVVHVHHWWLSSDDLVRRAAARGRPVAVTLHDHFTSCPIFFRVRDSGEPCSVLPSVGECGPCLGDRFSALQADLAFTLPQRVESYRAELAAASVIMVPSASHGAACVRYLALDRPVEVVPLGVPERAVVTVARSASDPGSLRVLHFGNLVRAKGVELLALAMERADPGGERISARFLGRALEADLFTGRARLSGAYTPADLAEAAATSDLAVFPSLVPESYGLVVDEALRLGLPVLVADHGALPERIGGRGATFRAGNVDDLARVLREFSNEPSRLDRMWSAPQPTLTSPRRFAELTSTHYERIRFGAPVVVDLEGPLMARVRRYHQRLTELPEFLERIHRGVADHEGGEA